MTHKTPALDAPMTEQEVAQVFDAWYECRANIAARSPQTMIEILEVLSPIVGEIFELRKKINTVWQGAEDRYYGRTDVVRPFRRGVSPKHTQQKDLLKELNMSKDDINEALKELGLIT